MGAAPYRAVNGLFSVGVEAIFIAADKPPNSGV